MCPDYTKRTIGGMIIELLSKNQNIKCKQSADEKTSGIATLTEESRGSETKFKLHSQSKSLMRMNNETSTKEILVMIRKNHRINLP